MSARKNVRHYHAWLGLLLGGWLYGLLVLLAPFDVAPLGVAWRAMLMLGYWLIFFLSYQLGHVLEEYFFQGTVVRGWWRELRFLLIFVFLNFPLVYAYYKSPLVVGEYSFWSFVGRSYLTTLLLVIPLLLYGRHWIRNRGVRKGPTPLLLRGNNKQDVLQLLPGELLYLVTARNYVEVHFRKGEARGKKLLRTTLKSIAVDHPGLLQVHRSYLVNPDHITGWKSNKTILLEGEVIPVSESFREAVIGFFESRPPEGGIRP